MSNALGLGFTDCRVGSTSALTRQLVMYVIEALGVCSLDPNCCRPQAYDIGEIHSCLRGSREITKKYLPCASLVCVCQVQVPHVYSRAYARFPVDIDYYVNGLTS